MTARLVPVDRIATEVLPAVEALEQARAQVDLRSFHTVETELLRLKRHAYSSGWRPWVATAQFLPIIVFFGVDSIAIRVAAVVALVLAWLLYARLHTRWRKSAQAQAIRRLEHAMARWLHLDPGTG
ncbi:MAG: hypothetical protein K2P58_06050 [Hyphomonadaceae bacterium]|nr:hypothetical protein [Hyphomonadaceae bacterium]